MWLNHNSTSQRYKPSVAGPHQNNRTHHEVLLHKNLYTTSMLTRKSLVVFTLPSLLVSFSELQSLTLRHLSDSTNYPTQQLTLRRLPPSVIKLAAPIEPSKFGTSFCANLWARGDAWYFLVELVKIRADALFLQTNFDFYFDFLNTLLFVGVLIFRVCFIPSADFNFWFFFLQFPGTFARLPLN